MGIWGVKGDGGDLVAWIVTRQKRQRHPQEPPSKVKIPPTHPVAGGFIGVESVNAGRWSLESHRLSRQRQALPIVLHVPKAPTPAVGGSEARRGADLEVMEATRW